ncbi:hypothetical protein ACTG9Q_13215 [Actinokineospora sp. 24-640]
MTEDSSSPEAVQNLLAKRAAGGVPSGEQQLVFDPVSGQLKAMTSADPDAVIATSTTDAGYFAVPGARAGDQ